MLLSRERLLVLLNALYYCGTENIELSYPPVDMIFYIDLKKKEARAISSKEYGKKLSEFKEKLGKDVDPVCISELPNSNALKDCLYISGVLKPKNISEIETELIQLAKKDPMKGDRLLLIGFDTNALRRRVNIYIQKILIENRLKARFCHSSLIFDELFRQYDKKLPYEWYPPEALSFMKNFSNQSIRDARLARLGAVEYKKLKDVHSQEVKGDDSKDNPDLKIVKSYESLKTENDLLLISGDKNFHDIAQAKGMKIIEVKEPHEVPSSIPISWEGACDLIFVAAVCFGMINVNGVKVYGVWGGKDVNNWNKEELKIEIEGGSKIKLDRFNRIISD
ncbi:MAG: hypothetical protein KKI06_05280 [Euryarchaeota archaeon]|nr:hypothetical protein [Euryarchaeota archaeon]